ncbi:PRC-barrel domain-containing protein [Paracoccus ravus]|uniref:PRC-barrel domain-containing protein n=1 Tax=Paracoccus ravus TaxID=2447760 RepID=UPI00106E3B0E|nr:PRC-barrel domain-containing protein [Paracoccus ravus]
MNRFVTAAFALTLVAPVHAQTTAPAVPAQGTTETVIENVEAAAQTAEAAAENAEAAADSAATEAGAAAERAVDAAGAEADKAADAAAIAADDAATATTQVGGEAADAVENAAEDAEEAASNAADSAAEAAAEQPVAAPDVNPPPISEAEPGLLGSWLTSRRIWTTNEPSSTAWNQPETMEERPVGWQDIAKVNDIVLDDSGEVLGYIADIGGFLGIGAKKVLLGKDAIHLVTVGADTFFATNYTKDELTALPGFDEKTVRK